MVYALTYSIEGLKLCTNRNYGIEGLMFQW